MVYRKARNVLQSKGHVAKSKEERFSDNSRQMARTRKLQKFIEGPRCWWARSNYLRSTCFWRDMIIQPQKLKEWDTFKIGFWLWMLKGNNHLDHYAQITKKQNENVNDYKTNSWQKRSSSLHPSTQVNKDVKNPNQQFQGSEEYDYVVDRKTGWRWF